MDRLHNQPQPQPQPQAPCLLCGSQVEDHNHLFFKCTYSAEVWREISLKAQVSWSSVPWRQTWEYWAVALYGGFIISITVVVFRKAKDDVIHMVRGILANIGERDKLPESIQA
ncbi:hypothetical protein OIU78_027353 [Salix suchowensis]|nr:hypothetical protein OIU78_027353 [Salix suchowensis]